MIDHICRIKGKACKDVEFVITLHQKVSLVASEKQLHRSTKRKSVLNMEIRPPVIKIRLELTRHNLQGIYTERIGINLPNGVNDVPRLVEAFEPEASREQIHPL